MSLIMVDVEADGPIPGDFSMVTFGAVVVEPSLSKTFYGELKPISESWVPKALAVGGYIREQTLKFDDPNDVMFEFKAWIEKNSKGHSEFISDNNGFDYMFIHWYFHHFVGDDPFGHTSRNLNDLYKGMMKNMKKSFKHLRKTKHDHNPVNDAKSNAEALLKMQNMGLKINLV